jgi:hypothetical protein
MPVKIMQRVALYSGFTMLYLMYILKYLQGAFLQVHCSHAKQRPARSARMISRVVTSITPTLDAVPCSDT